MLTFRPRTHPKHCFRKPKQSERNRKETIIINNVTISNINYYQCNFSVMCESKTTLDLPRFISLTSSLCIVFLFFFYNFLFEQQNCMWERACFLYFGLFLQNSQVRLLIDCDSVTGRRTCRETGMDGNELVEKCYFVTVKTLHQSVRLINYVHARRDYVRRKNLYCPEVSSLLITAALIFCWLRKHFCTK